jgi:hypothetical protein
VAAAMATIVESQMTSVGSLAKWDITKRRVQEGRWIKELGIIRYIVTQKISFLSIDSDEFSDMLSDFGQSLDAKATILKLIPPLYQFVLTKKCSRLHQCSALSFAADFWTSKAARKYMGLADFGIDPSWTLQNEVMDFVCFPGSIIAELCTYVMKQRAERHAHEDQLLAHVVTDCGSDLKAARGMLEIDHDDCANRLLNSSSGDVSKTKIKAMIDIQTIEYLSHQDCRV